MTTTNPTDAQMKLAREALAQAATELAPPSSSMRMNDFTDKAAQISARAIVLAIQATEARAQGLVELLEMVDSIEYKELNLSNYTHDDVCALNNAYVEMQLILTQALATWRRT